SRRCSVLVPEYGTAHCRLHFHAVHFMRTLPTGRVDANVPEYGTANGRLHFHAVHFMRTLPTGSVDPNFGRRVRNRRQLNSLQNRSEERFSRNAETDLVCRLLLEKKNRM